MELHPSLFPSELPQFVGPWTLQGVESVPQGCWPMFTPMLQVVWMSFGWWTILDTHGKLLGVKNPAVLQFFTQSGVPGNHYHIPVQRHLHLLPIHPLSEWHTYTIHVSIVSRLKNPSLTYLLSFIYTDWSGFNINKGSKLSPLFTWSVCHEKSRCS